MSSRRNKAIDLRRQVDLLLVPDEVFGAAR